jgi:hypothetical protein
MEPYVCTDVVSNKRPVPSPRVFPILRLEQISPYNLVLPTIQNHKQPIWLCT